MPVIFVVASTALQQATMSCGKGKCVSRLAPNRANWVSPSMIPMDVAPLLWWSCLLSVAKFHEQGTSFSFHRLATFATWCSRAADG